MDITLKYDTGSVRDTIALTSVPGPLRVCQSCVGQDNERICGQVMYQVSPCVNLDAAYWYFTDAQRLDEGELP
jgi:hypothetical protein